MTDSSYDPNAYEYVSSMNPNVLDASNKRKVVRGGFKMLLIPTGSRDFEYLNASSFRNRSGLHGIANDRKR
jgi:hypothetical protein